ncbi:MAG TPA: zf-HC2 domain-containing protein [Bryobacteraceae bacterium]|jgi:hypothetical protein|nr:zf-HC2 domain-containing protein [Bryobacteraceae bacterium]
MSCQEVQKSISAFVDRSLGAEEHETVRVHLENCRMCHVRAEQVSRLRSEIRSMPMAVPPAILASRLRVLASHERARALAHRSYAALWKYWRERLALTVNNLMRPVALPFAGGLLSALFLFGMLVPTLGFHHNFRNDVPIGLYTQASVDEISPFGITTDDTVVELTIDEKGQITDYFIPAGKDSQQLEANIANMVLFSTFTPATWFGQPTSSKILVSFRRSHIVVRG